MFGLVFLNVVAFRWSWKSWSIFYRGISTNKLKGSLSTDGDKKQEYQLPDVVIDGFASEGINSSFSSKIRQRLQYLCIGRVRSSWGVSPILAVKKMVIAGVVLSTLVKDESKMSLS